MTVLSVQDLAVSYGDVQAIKKVSLSVDQGEVVALLGPNGAGKSTLMRTIAGLKDASRGSIHFFGADMRAVPTARRARMGLVLVPEGRHIFPRLTVEENLLVGAWGRGNVDSDLDRIHEMFPILANRAKLPAMALSGGEQQLLAMGRALMRQPRLLLLDEPSLGLSPVAVSQVFSVIERINADGVTVVLVEQDTRKALKIADRGYVLVGGEIQLEGDSVELQRDEQVRMAYLGGPGR
jgi:branched-chain amino acid transport system ATP-binding protein